MFSEEQELAVLNALSDVIEKRKAQLRKSVDAKLIAAYEEEGIDRKCIKINGREVGTLSIVDGGAQLEIDDEEKFLEWAIHAGAAVKRTYINADMLPVEEVKQQWPEAVNEAWMPVKGWQDWLVTFKANTPAGFKAVDANGEVVEGLREVQKPVRTMLRKCKFKDVAPCLTAEDMHAFFDTPGLLLGGGTDA